MIAARSKLSRNIALKVLRGVKANLPPLFDGEFYLTTDTAELFVGFFGGTLKVANMSIPIQDSAGNNLTSTAGALDVNIKTDAVTLPVSVTNFPATQPVSAVALPLPAGAAADATLTSGAQKTQVTNFPATQPTTVTNFPASQPTTQVGGASGLVGDTQAKGIQGTVALMVQDFKDAGRVVKVFTGAFSATAAEAMVSLTPVSDGTAGVAATTFAVTAGKRLRLQAFLLSLFNTTAAIRGCQVNLRMSATGAVTTASPLIGTVAATTAAATIGLAASQAQGFADGVELSGTQQFGVSQIGIALAGQTVVVIGYEY